MNRKTKKILGLISWLPLLIVAVYIYNSNSDRDKHLSSNKIGYNAGVIEEYQDLYRSPPEFIFSYRVNGQSYESSYFLEKNLIYLTVDSLKKYIGKKYTVEYSIEKPRYSKLLIV